MINRLIEFSLKNRGLILLAYALLAVWGYWALLRTPIDAIPEIRNGVHRCPEQSPVSPDSQQCVSQQNEASVLERKFNKPVNHGFSSSLSIQPGVIATQELPVAAGVHFDIPRACRRDLDGAHVL